MVQRRAMVPDTEDVCSMITIAHQRLPPLRHQRSAASGIADCVQLSAVECGDAYDF